MYTKFALPLALSGLSFASAQSICDKYTTALLTDNTAANQFTLLQLVVNTVVIGNYTKPNVGIAVPGILAPANFNNEAVALLPYFNGCLKSSNRGKPTAINFLDGGGAASVIDGSLLTKTSTNQYELFLHLYEFFGTLLGCSQQGQPGFPAYDGQPSMFQVHKYMGLDPNEVGYFISQVGAAAASFGVSNADVTAVAGLLGSTFNVACAPKQALVNNDAEFQSICTADTCPLAPGSVCNQYENNGVFPEPQPAYGPGCPADNGGHGGDNGGGYGKPPAGGDSGSGWNSDGSKGYEQGEDYGNGGHKVKTCPVKHS